MRSDAQLDYAVFQLTPTRTRCELLVAAQGKTYKLASGLLKPFVAHLRTAEEQIARGGYSIRLEPPDHCLPATWFTKGTMERFVRFVSTPEVLERVSTVESELLELEETSRTQQCHNVSDEIDMVEDPSSKLVPSPSSTRVKSTASVNAERQTKLLDGAENATEGNTKQCLLRALDARRLMLQKEQGMSFARAIAAGFSIEYMDDLVSFAECFGADRLREACLKFIALCKKRQESGLWQDDLDLAARETARVQGGVGDIQGQLDDSRRASFPIERMAHMAESGPRNHNRRGSLDGMVAERAPEASAMRFPATIGDYSPSTWSKNGVEYMRGHPAMAAWPGHLGPVSPHEAIHHSSLYGFPSPGMPYPQHLGNPYTQSLYAENNGWQMPAPPFWPGNHSANAFNDGVPHGLQQTPPRAVADRDVHGSIGGNQNHQSPKNAGEEDDRDVESEMGRSLGRSSSPRRWSVSPRRKGRSGSKRAGTVVIRNINYITPNLDDRHLDAANDDTELSTASSEDGDHGYGNGMTSPKAGNARGRAHDVIGLSESKNGCGNDVDTSLFVDRTRISASAHDPAEREFRMSNLSHKVHRIAEKGDQVMDNSFALNGKEPTGRAREMHSDMLAEQKGQGDKRLSASHDSFILPDNRRNLAERDGRISDADFEISGKVNPSFQQQNNGDDSFIVYDRIVSRDESNADWRSHLNLESEVPSGKSITADASEAAQRAVEYFEPDDLFMLPERNKDTVYRTWNTPVDYDMQALAGDVMDSARHGQEHDSSMDPSGNGTLEDENKESKVKSKENTKALEKGTKNRALRPAIVRPGKPNPLVEAQLRADKLRAYKAELQKSKKEKEDEDRKRIEELKRQRQERIASRSSTMAGVVKSPSTNRTVRAASLNASTRSSLSVTPRKLPALSPSSGARSFMSPRTRDLISTKLSRSTENAVQHLVPSLSELRKKESAKIPPASASAAGAQLKKNGENTSPLSVLKASSHVEDKRGPLALATVIKKGAAPPAKDNSKVEGSALVNASKTPTVANKQEKKQIATAGSKKHVTQEQTATLDMKNAAASIQIEGSGNTESCKVVQNIELQEDIKLSSAREGKDHPHASKEEEAYEQIRAPASSDKEVTGACADVEGHQSEAKCAEDATPGKPVAILEDYSVVNSEQAELRCGSRVASLRLLPLSGAVYVEQSESCDGNEQVGYQAPVARLSTDEQSPIEKELPGVERYNPPYALISSIDFDKDAEGFEKRTTTASNSLDRTISHISEHNSTPPLQPPPYAPPTDSPMTTPSKDSPTLLEAIQHAESAEADSGVLKPGKKRGGGDGGALQKTPKEHSTKGLKKLLLLGRKSSRSPVQTSSEWTQGSMASEEGDNVNVNDGDNDELSPCKITARHAVSGARSTPPDGSNSGGKLKVAIQTEATPTKSSRSFFSLPAFRSKGEGRA